MRLDPAVVRQQLEQLKLLYPELVADDDAWGLTLESETDLTALLTMAEESRQEAAAWAAGIATRIAELGIRQQRYERREQAMRVLIFKFLKAAEVPKIELAIATLSIRKGGSKLVIPDDTAVPDEFCKVTRTPDKVLIKDALKSVSFNWAALETGPESIAIRTK